MWLTIADWKLYDARREVVVEKDETLRSEIRERCLIDTFARRAQLADTLWTTWSWKGVELKATSNLDGPTPKETGTPH